MGESSAVSEDVSMKLQLCFKQRAEKSTGGEVILMEWSPTMDILALAFSDHSVVLNRLSWQKVWSIPPIKSLPTAMAWRPDGKVLAVGCCNGTVGLYNVENGQVINEFAAGVAVTCLSWAKMEEGDEGELSGGHTSLTQGWSELLPPLPAVDRRTEDNFPDDPKLLQPTDTLKSLHLLFVGDDNGCIHICALGIFLIACLKSSDYKNKGPVVFCKMSTSFKEICGLTLSKQRTQEDMASLTLEVFETSLLSTKSCELQNLVLEFGHVICHLEYLNSIITAMFEAWDDLLFNLDSQLASYAKTLPEGRTVADEFLVLLACGRASQDLKDFLTFKLTAKGVKKLGLSLEHSYTNIKKFLLHHFQVGIQGLLVHLGELLEMVAGQEQFGMLGLSAAAIQAGINLAGTLGLKSQEMILAIDHSLRSVKVFFMWLYVTILKISNEQVPKGLKDDLTPEELKLIMDFLKKRLTKARSGNHAFNLETVGQYLSNNDLKFVEEKPIGFWEEFVVNYHQSLPSSSVPSVFKPSHKKSLLQLYRQLRHEVEDAFTKPTGSVGKSFLSSIHREIEARFKSIPCERLDSLMCHFRHNEVSGFCIPSSEVEVSDSGRQSCCSQMDLVQYSTHDSGQILKRISFYIQHVEGLSEKEDDKRCSIVSVRPYDSDNLTVLSQYSFKVPEEDPSASNSTSTKMVTVTHSVLAQVPFAAIFSMVQDKVSHDASDIGPLLTHVHVLEPFKSGKLAVMGGTRKLAAVVSHNGKKIRLFDVDEEEDEDQNLTMDRSTA